MKQHNLTRDQLKRIKQLVYWLQSAFIGLMLSDAHLRGTSHTSNVIFSQWFGPPYLSFGLYVHMLFSAFIKAPLKLVVRSSGHTSYWLYSRTLPVFRNYHSMFYVWDQALQTYIKIVPLEIETMMNPIVLAFLIMGDGNYDWSRERIRIYTNSFTYEDTLRLANSITKMGIKASVMFDRKSKDKTKDQYIITIGKKQFPLLRQLVLPFMHYSMYYKLGIRREQIDN